MESSLQNALQTRGNAAGLFLTGDYPSAKAAFEALRKDFPDDQNLLADALLSGLLAKDVDEKAADDALTLFEQSRATPPLLYVLAQLYRAEGMGEIAADILENLRKEDELNISIAQDLAALYQELYEGDKLESLIKAVFPKFAADERVLCMAAAYAHAFGNTAQAKFLYRRAMRKNRSYTLNFPPFYKHLLDMKSCRKVIRCARRALKTFPDAVFLKESLLTALIRTQRLKDAAAVFADMSKNPETLNDDILAFWAETLSGEGKYDEAFDTAFRISPRYEKYDNLFFLLSKLLYLMRDSGKVRECFDRAARWSAAFPDDAEIQHVCAAVSGKSDTPTPSPDFARKVFDNMAPDFEYILVERLQYKGPQLLGSALKNAKIPTGKSKAALDLGCGTGLCGAVLKPYADRFGMLTGVDVSPKMLDEARKKAIYDRLEQNDILSYLAQTGGQAFDIVSAMDVTGYFGDLQPLAQGVYDALNDGGAFVFSVAAGTDARPYMLLPSGRYAHYVPYVEAMLQSTGFEIVSKSAECLRKELKKPVLTTVFTVRRI